MRSTTFQFCLAVILLFGSHPLYAKPEAKSKKVPQPTPQQLLNPDWIEKQLENTGIDKLISKYEGQQQIEIRLVQSALDLSRHILREHPEALRNQLQARLISHKHPLLQVFQKLPDNKIQIVAMSPVLEQAGGILVRQFSSQNLNVVCSSFLADEKRAVIVTNDGKITTWEIGSGLLLRSVQNPKRIIHAIVSSDRKTLLTHDAGKKLKVWNLNNSKLLHEYEGGHVHVSSMLLSADGTHCVIRYDNSSLMYWNLDTNKILHTFSHYKGDGRKAFFSDGKRFLTISQQQIMIWNLLTGKIIKKIALDLKIKHIYEASITADGNFAIILGNDDSVLLNLKTGKYRFYPKIGKDRYYADLRFPPFLFSQMVFHVTEKKIIANLSGVIRYSWDINTGKTLTSMPSVYPEYYRISVTHDAKYMLASGGDNGAIYLLNIADKNRVLSPPKKKYQFTCLEISPDSKLVLTGDKKGMIRLWDLESFQLIRSFSGHTRPIQSLCFTPDGKRAISIAKDGPFSKVLREKPILWDLSTGKAIQSFQFPGSVKTLAITPDGKEFIAGTKRQGIIVYDLNAGKSRSIPKITSSKFGPAPGLNSVDFILSSMNGKEIITVDHGGDWVRFWSRENLKLKRSVTMGQSDIEIVASSADGKQILLGNEIGKIGVISGQKQDVQITRYYYGHHGRINLLAVLPGDQLALSGSARWSRYDKNEPTLQIWDIENKSKKATFYLEKTLLSPRLSPDGKYIISINRKTGWFAKLRIDHLPK